ncbi:MAG: pyridine nucleotide-disulfide oxidoreductase, partial [Stellaceae bacterium]
MTELFLKHGLAFADLYDRDGLIRIDREFIVHLAATDAGLRDRLMAARAAPDSLDRKDESDLLVDLAPHVEDFVGELFGIGGAVREMQARHERLAPLYSVKRLFVQRRAVKEIKQAEAAALDGVALTAEIDAMIGGVSEDFSTRPGVLAWESRYAEQVGRWLDDEAAHAGEIVVALRYAAWATLAPKGQAKHHRGLLFKLPNRLDMQHLVPVEIIERDGVTMMRLPEHEWRARDGFGLTDPGTDLAGALDQANYCIWCHNQGKDSCSSGLKEKDAGFKKSVFGVTLAGCPLDEKISEINLVESRGYSLGALALVAVDNPICAATGHRICNDCMKSCIYQRQDPVDIPQIETRVLKDVLVLPWGFEVYSLLTRWNPLDVRRPLPKPASGYKVLVVGLGPAGFTLAHHLINDGHFVAAIDGLKIEPLPPGIADAGFKPIRDVGDLYERLDERRMAGFGGVAEYGITVRWNKNFLKVIRLLLERRSDQ